MAMTYTSLVGDKTQIGSIASWVNYSKLQPTVIVDEAQALVYSLIRTREMLADFSFAMAVGQANIPLPTGFLDPIGRMYMTSFNLPIRHKDSSFIQQNRNYTELSGTLGTNPFTTAASSNSVNVSLTNHGFNQDSLFSTSGATAFNGVTIVGTFPVTATVDVNDFTIDISNLGTTPSGSGAGGGASITYLCDNLIAAFPNWYGIWNETIYFDTAFVQPTICKMQYYKSLPLLSSTNQTNFLTNRYPQLMRVACVTSAADFMKDTEEYQKGMTRLGAIVDRVSVENDMSWRGMELDTYTP